MLGNLAVRATAAVLGLGSMAAPCTTAGPARGLLQRAAAARPALPPCARCLFGTGWARGLAGNATQGQQAAPGSSVAAASYAYEAVAQDPAAAAEIAEIDFDASLVNTVRLIGTVGGKKDLKVFERSKLLPFAIGIKPDRRKPEEIEWINVEVWGPLAERANQELNKGDRVAVQGRLKVDKWEDRATGARRTAFKIVASSISRVRSNYPAAAAAAAAGAGQYGEVSSADAGFGGGGGYEQAPWDPPTAAAPWDPPAQQQQPRVASGGQQQGGQQQGGQQQRTMEELWMDYFEHPDSWYDNRTNKRSPKAPDFKKKEGGREAPALWVDSRGTPGWVEAELKRLDGNPFG